MAVPKTAALPLGDSPIAVPEKQAFQKGPGNYTKVYLFFEVQLLFCQRQIEMSPLKAYLEMSPPSC